MERHRCKLCSKNFSNGRALGGHMRSHLFNLPISEEMPAKVWERKPVYHAESASSASSSSSSSSEEDEGDGKDQGYGLRENPTKSVRLADPEFSFAGSVVLQDGGSETESSKNPTRRRSKRIQNSPPPPPPPPDSKKKIKLSDFSGRVEESCHRVELEQGSSSISDATTDQDVAFCLIMLSRDKWKRQKRTKEAKFMVDQDLDVEEKRGEEEEEEEEEDEQDEETDESEGLENCKVTAYSKNYKSRGKHRCETCEKTFRSYQALGGHRASHKKAQLLPPPPLLAVQLAAHEPAPTGITARGDSAKVHECPYCSRVFSSGQALGGHKRSHTANSGTSITVPFPGKKSGDSLIDLNLPAPVDYDDLVELSAVSNAKYLYHVTR